VVVDGTIANELDLRLTGYGLQVWVEDGLNSLAGLVVTVAVALRRRVKGLLITLVT
jgi:hypothetical protein